MITVRFPTGFSVQYNDAQYSFRENIHTLLWDSPQKKKLFAVVPNCSGAIIEHAIPCRTYNAETENSEAALLEEMAFLTKEVRSLKRKVV